MKTAVQTLQKYWGFDGFRPAQQLVLQSVLEGKDTLALLPTGGGKSICFQVPSMMKEGICIVISPLIALMKDQVQALKEKEIKSHAIFAGMSYKDMDRIFDNCIYGDVKFLYVSPERIQTELFQERVKKMSVSYLVVDESHCISQWGYDFRPAYLRIRDLRDWIGHEVPVIALTATATQAVQADIIERLKVPDRSFNSVQVSFKRDNLSYNVFYYENKIIQMIQMIQRIEGSAIIYVRNRRKTKEIAHVLVKHHISANYKFEKVVSKVDSIVPTIRGNELERKLQLLKALSVGKNDSKEAYKKALEFVSVNFGNFEEGKKAKEILKKLNK